MFGLHESTKSLEAMKEGVSESLEDLADIGGKVQEAAVRAGYGPTIRAEAVAKLEYRDVVGAASQVEYRDLLVALLVQPLGERGSRRLIDDPLDLQSGNFTSLFGRLAL